MKVVLFWGMYRFPHGDAPSNRILSMAKSVRAGGLRPIVIGNGSIGCGSLRSGFGTFECEEIEYCSVRRGDGFFKRALVRLFQTYYLTKKIRRFDLDLDEVQCVVTTQGTLTLSLILLCRYVWKKPLVVDCMEWFEPFQFKFGRLSPAYIAFAYKFHFLCRLVAGIFAISRVIERHFMVKGVSVLRVPPQVDCSRYEAHESAENFEYLDVFYAGSISRKDDLQTVLAGLLMLTNAEIGRVRFTIAGPTKVEIGNLLCELNADESRLEGVLCVKGRVSRENVLDLLARSSFTILIRPDSLYSAAGFPSKIPESLASGTPVITNLTSDLNDYISDGVEALVVSNSRPESVAAAIRRALALDSACMNAMFSRARNRARVSFDYHVQSNEIVNFLLRSQ